VYYLTNEPVASVAREVSQDDSSPVNREARVCRVDVRKVVIGVLAVQGDFDKHVTMLNRMPLVEAKRVRFTEELEELDGLIIPGGESTTFTIHYDRWGYREAISDFILSGRHVWGTCAGAIMLSSRVFDNDEQVDVQPLCAVDCDAVRNGWGRQVDSFEAPVIILDEYGESKRFVGVFIRAPRFRNVGLSARITGIYADEPVMIEQNNVMISSFHPELTDDSLVHEYFAGKVRASLENLK
jgi:pyridoxal 5'-phosphate synthase pdxT subunit